MEYLSRREVGLEKTRDELSWFQEQAILFVAGQRQKIREEMREGGDLDDDDMAFRAEADPDEMDVSDGDLLSLVAARKRKR